MGDDSAVITPTTVAPSRRFSASWNTPETSVRYTDSPETPMTRAVAPDVCPFTVSPAASPVTAVTIRPETAASAGLARPSNRSYPGMRVYPPLTDTS